MVSELVPASLCPLLSLWGLSCFSCWAHLIFLVSDSSIFPTRVLKPAMSPRSLIPVTGEWYYMSASGCQVEFPLGKEMYVCMLTHTHTCLYVCLYVAVSGWAKIEFAHTHVSACTPSPGMDNCGLTLLLICIPTLRNLFPPPAISLLNYSVARDTNSIANPQKTLWSPGT